MNFFLQIEQPLYVLFLGWAVAEDESRNWEFRLTLFYAKMAVDSDVFTCKTPRGKRNSVNVVVTGEANATIYGLDSE